MGILCLICVTVAQNETCLYCQIITTELAHHKVLSNSDSCNRTCDYAWCHGLALAKFTDH